MFGNVHVQVAEDLAKVDQIQSKIIAQGTSDELILQEKYVQLVLHRNLQIDEE